MRWTDRLWPNSQEEPEAKRQDLIRRQRSPVESWPIAMCLSVSVCVCECVACLFFRKSCSTTSETSWAKEQENAGGIQRPMALGWLPVTLRVPSLANGSEHFWHSAFYGVPIFKGAHPCITELAVIWTYTNRPVSFSVHCWTCPEGRAASSDQRSFCWFATGRLLCVWCQQAWLEDTPMIYTVDVKC